MSTDHWWNVDVTSYMFCNCVEITVCCKISTIVYAYLADMEVSESDEEHLSHMEM